MIVRRFLLWVRDAQPGHRAEATAALANAFLYADLSADDRWEAETALTAMLDDPSPVVRRAMAETLAASPDAPRHVVLTLAADQSEIAAPVLAHSPLLIDADLVDAVALGDARAQTAIASRPGLSAALSGALGEIAGPDVLLVLARNAGAEIAESTLLRVVERHASDGALREALLERPDLPVAVAQAIAAALAKTLDAFVTACGWLSPQRSERVVRESCERATVSLSSLSDEEDVRRLVAHLRVSRQLTAGLILRALLSQQTAFVHAAFVELSGLPTPRVTAALRNPAGNAFGALYDRAGLPGSLRVAFGGALVALNEETSPHGADVARLSRRLVRRALDACDDIPPAEAGRLVALLRRFDAEAAREDARGVAGDLADDAALDIVLRFAPQALIGPDQAAA